VEYFSLDDAYFGEDYGSCYYKGYNPNIGTRDSATLNFFYLLEYPEEGDLGPSYGLSWCSGDEGNRVIISSTRYAYVLNHLDTPAFYPVLREILSEIESKNLGLSCSSGGDSSSSTGGTDDTSESKQESADATKDSRCPEKYVSQDVQKDTSILKNMVRVQL